MIIASAIKYHINGNDVVLCGVRHGDILNQLLLIGFNIEDVEELEQGFVDHQNNFLSRREAFHHAKNCGQLSSKIAEDKERQGWTLLISEDLW